MQTLAVIGAIFVGIAALVHFYIFYLESIIWSRPRTWKTFGLKSQADADIVKPMAFNQGYYNAFLAVGALIGLILLTTNAQQAGYALIFLAAGSMVFAATVLITSSPKLARAAVLQGAAPLIGVVLLVVSLRA
jgi:putative membrane protein